MLTAIRHDVTRILAHAQFAPQPVEPRMPSFVTTHIDPLTGEDDTRDIDAASLGLVTTRIAPLPTIELADDVDPSEWKGQVSRNAPCPCGSGSKYKHCHGAVA